MFDEAQAPFADEVVQLVEDSDDRGSWSKKVNDAADLADLLEGGRMLLTLIPCESAGAINCGCLACRLDRVIQ